MGWSTDFYDNATYDTTTTSASELVKKYHDRKFLEMTSYKLVLPKWGQMRPLPTGSGKTINFTRYLDIDPDDTALTESVNPNATQINAQELEATIAEYGDFSKHSSLLTLTAIDEKLRGVRDLWATHAARSINRKVMKEVAAHAAQPLRADLSTTYSYSGTLTGVSSTTVMADTDLETNTNYGDANDDLNQSIITITSGTAKGQQRVITDYATSGGAITVSPAFDTEPAVGDGYTVTSADATLTSSTDIGTSSIFKGVEMLYENGAPTYKDGFLKGLISPHLETQLLADSDFKAVHEYKDRTKGLEHREIGIWGGVRWYSTNEPFRFPQTTIGTAGSSYGVGASGANYSATGDVESTFIMGPQAFGITTFTRGKGKGAKLVAPIIVEPASKIGGPLHMFSTIGWKLEFVAKGLNPLFGVQIWTVR